MAKKFRKRTDKKKSSRQTAASDKSGTNRWFKHNNIYLTDNKVLKKLEKVKVNLAPKNIVSVNDWQRNHLLSDEFIESKNNKKNKNYHVNRQNNRRLSSKEKIIIENKERIRKLNVENELGSLKYKFNNPFHVKTKTRIGEFVKALKCLKKSYKENNIEALYDVYFCYRRLFLEYYIKIQDFDKKSIKKCKNLFIVEFFKFHKIIKKVERMFTSIKDLKVFQFEKMGSYLAPLDFKNYYNHEFILDKWQIQFLDYIDKNRSVLLCAPTSSGKTFLTNYLVKKSNRILFIVPTMPLALQVSSMFSKALSGGNWIVDEKILDLKENVTNYPRFIVGTPNELLKRIHQLDIQNIDTLVIDEIHEMNNNDAIEPIIHIMSKQPKFKKFLGLSATIGNPDNFYGWLKKLIPNMEKIVVNERFFNLSRYVFSDGTINSISPFNIMSYDLFVNNIEKFIDYPFTPHEVLKLMNDMIEIGFEIKNVSDYFGDIIKIGLKETKIYCNYLFDNLKDKNNLSLVKQCFDRYEFKSITNDIYPIYDVCKVLSVKNTPAIIFHLNNISLKKYFDELLEKIEEAENLAHPNYQDLLFKKNEKYEKVMENYEKELNKIKNENKRIDYMRDNPYPEAPLPVGSPHEDFIFKVNGCGTDFYEINKLRNNMKKYFQRKRMEDQIPGLNRLFNALLRGFAIYCEDLPMEYLICVQELTQKGKIAFVFSDKSLAVGINMPFRNVVFYGDSVNCTPLMIQQMEGRAGRRGLDRVGNSIFVNFTEERIKYLLNTHIENIESKESVLKENILTLSGSVVNKEKIIKSIYTNNLRNINVTNYGNISKKVNLLRHKDLYWALRRFDESYEFVYFIDWFIKNPKLHKRDNEQDDIYIFSLFSLVLQLDFEFIESVPMKWNTNDENVQNALNHLNNNEFINIEVGKLNDSLFKIFQINKIDDKIRNDNDKFSNVKASLERVNLLLTVTRNFLKMSTAEEIIRKMQRRINWLIKTFYIY